MKKTKKNEKLISQLILGLVFFISLGYMFVRPYLYKYLLSSKGVVTNAIIINERGFNGKNGHILKEKNGDKIIYCYSFFVNKKEYIGDSQSPLFKIGDTINVVYVSNLPWINSPRCSKCSLGRVPLCEE
ncbi:hypothetical protein [Flavobacterium psychrophilum]|uniref:hypothetical protein n=1 Tax=Flavobacterium psychrophilum TaxID=96345 RepID=UPI000B7C0D79|nr:hypothetical protein [Flavobacterium psychrophilum]SNA73644.1 hypothetical protein DK095_330001 [Flavobacterium psychrophilum]